MFNIILKYLPENNRLERIWKLCLVDFKKRYYDHRLGILWALINPLFKIFVYWVVFAFIFETKTENHGLFIFISLLFWMFFAEATKTSLSIFKSKRYLLENIQFNTLDLFYSSTFSSFIGFIFNLTAYFIISLILNVKISLLVLFLPVSLALVFLLAFSSSLILASIKIRIKDIDHVWDMTLFAGFWASPILYPITQIPDNFSFIIYLNPMFGIMENARNTIL